MWGLFVRSFVRSFVRLFVRLFVRGWLARWGGGGGGDEKNIVDNMHVKMQTVAAHCRRSGGWSA